MKKIIITIDGFAGTGKWTTARGVAEKMWYIHLDTGALYRAITLYFLQKNISVDDVELIKKEFSNIDIKFENWDVLLNWKNVESEIRKSYISEKVPYYSQILELRLFCNKIQQKIWKGGGFVIDARDAATVVFPDAELKIFLETDLDVKAKRRRKELLGKWENISLEQVKNNLKKRDLIDTKNTYKLPDSVVIDTTNLTIDEQVEKVIELAKDKI